MNEVYKSLYLRPLAKKLYWGLIFLCFFAIFLVFRFRYQEFIDQGWPFGFIKLLITSSLFLSILYKCIFFLRPRIFAEYRIYPEKAERHYKDKVEIIDFDQVKGVKSMFFSPRFVGGYILKMKSGEKFYFFPLLEDYNMLLKSLLSFRSDLSNSEKLNHYLIISDFVELSWERMRERFDHLVFLLLKYILLPAAVSVYYAYVNQGEFMSLLVDGFLKTSWLIYLLAFILNHFEEKLFYIHIINKEEVQKVRDKVFEKKLHVFIQILFYLLSFYGSYLIVFA